MMAAAEQRGAQVRIGTVDSVTTSGEPGSQNVTGRGCFLLPCTLTACNQPEHDLLSLYYYISL